MEWTRTGLAAAGFVGFVPFGDLPTYPVPPGPGVYLVLRPDSTLASFLECSVAGWFKGQDPSVDPRTLEQAWVPDAVVLYIGKAAAGTSGRRGLRKRLDEYRRHGDGHRAAHWGGRYIWKLRDSDRLLVAWRETPRGNPESLEARLIDDFKTAYGVKPFANRKAETRGGVRN